MIINNSLFESVVQDVPKVGKTSHSSTLVKNARYNSSYVKKTIRDLLSTRFDSPHAIVVSAGPGLHKFNSIQQIIDAKYQGPIIATDGSFIHCLKKGLIPDFVLSLDPHATRIVRWFGDPAFEQNMKGDDYYSRQDLDIDFRENSLRLNNQHIELVNKYACKTKLILCSSAPKNVTDRVLDAGFDIYWWNPLVDDPNSKDSLTRQLFNILKAPCFNTGGTVGTASWVFANQILRAKKIAVVGMDLGYHEETPYNLTQTYYELIDHVGEENLLACFKQFTFPLTGVRYYTDPTYYWYRNNILELIQQSKSILYNCTGGGTLFGENINCQTLNQFLTKTICE